MKFDINDYTFTGLRNPGKKDFVGCPSLCYLVSLVDSVEHKISETLVAKRILGWLFEAEEQASDAEALKVSEGFCSRYFSGGFYPQTPCMVVKEWSPMGAMLEHNFQPRVLNREPGFRAVATGIWEPQRPFGDEKLVDAKTDQALFWAIMAVVSKLATDRKMLINIIAQPGWDHKAAIQALPPWPKEQVAQAGRVLWKRTPRG